MSSCELVVKSLVNIDERKSDSHGFVTRTNRENLKLLKEHYIDACVIASGGKEFKLNNIIYQKRRVAKGDYQLTKGSRGQQKIPVGKIQSSRKFDKVKYFNKEYFIRGRMSTGFAVLSDIFNYKIDFSHMSKGWKIPKLLNLKRESARSSCLCISQNSFKVQFKGTSDLS